MAFYRELPFNYRGCPQEHAAHICAVDQIRRYPVLVPLLRKGCSVLDVGCGAGWFSLSAAYHYRAAVTGIDFNEVAIARARDVAKALRVAVQFETADLFRWESGAPFDIVASLGVLHHTNDCLAALRRCAQHVRSGGHLFVGLYHRYGRRTFLEHFRGLRAAGAGEAELLEHYRRLHASLTDEVHLRSWFRDQVLHPHETQHTLREVVPLLQDCGLGLVSSSLNGFAPFGDVEELFAAEPALEAVGAERLARGQYYPGFFLFLARKAAGSQPP
jgi:2-polyprenyl-3-methyl-5-hydroxy-6-metoxy-1,4-benzoquinol methylase